MLTSRGLPSDSTCVLKTEPGKLDIKLDIKSLPTSDYDVIFDFCVESESLATSFKK